MKIAITDDRGIPFRESAPVQSKFTVLNSILGRLLYADSNYDLSPGHLESFKWDYSKRAYILKLKKNLFFHNGREVDAKDLEFSILRGFFSKNRHWYEAFFGNLEGIEKVKDDNYESGKVDGVKVLDKYTLQIKIKKPNPSFLHSLTVTYFSLVPREEFEKDLITWKKFPIGVGPYKINKINPDNSVELSKVNNTSNKILLTVDGQEQDSDIVIANLKDSRELQKEVSSKTTSVTNIFFNYNNETANDYNFRKAIELMLDRSKLIEGVDSYKTTNQFLAAHFWGRIKDFDNRNLEAARESLAKVKNLNKEEEYKIPVFNSSFGNPILGKYLDQLKVQFKDLGLKISFYNSKEKFFNKNDTKTLFKIFSLGADVMEPLVLFGLMRGKSPFYPHYPEDSKFDRLFNLALEQETQESKIEKVLELSKYYYKNKFSIPLFERKLIYGFNSKRVKSLGKQDAGLTFLIENIEFKDEK